MLIVTSDLSSFCGCFGYLQRGSTALHLACQRHHSGIALMLLRAGCEMDTIDKVQLVFSLCVCAFVHVCVCACMSACVCVGVRVNMHNICLYAIIL